MSFWNSETQQVVRFPPKDVEGYPGWEEIDCGCCAGLQWGGFEPRECRDCGGGGYLFRHKRSGALAQYPGGPFCGREVTPKLANRAGIR